MFKRPSSRRKSKETEVSPNIIPMLDVLVTMISFLLYTMSFFLFVSIESPVPVTKSKDVAEKLKERPLQLTMTIRSQEVEVWSPFEKFPARTFQNPQDGQPDLNAIHEFLIGIKQKFPGETKVVVVPNSGTAYDTIVAVMDAARTLESTDTPIYVQNTATGNNEVVKVLFPDVVFGNLLGDT